MGTFSEQDVHHRIGTLAGKPAEQAFLRVLAAEGRHLGQKVFRLGLDQLPTSDGIIATLGPFTRYAPDFVAVGGSCYEVQGCGEDGLVTFKLEKLLTQAAWHAQLAAEKRDLRYAIYAQHLDLLFRVTFEHVLWAVATHGGILRVVVDDKLGWKVPVEAFLHGEVVNLGSAMRALKVK